MDIAKSLRTHKDKIELRLKSFLDEKIAEAEKLSTSSKEIMQHIKEFNLRGGQENKVNTNHNGL